MIRATAQWIESGVDHFAEIRKQLALMEKAYVSVGVHEDAGSYTVDAQGKALKNPPSVAQVALWAEFGTVNAPERSWLRSTIEEAGPKIEAWRDELVDLILDGKMTVERALNIIGQRLVILLQNKIKSNIPPALSASSIRAHEKAGVAPNTLILTGLFLRSVTYKVEMG